MKSAAAEELEKRISSVVASVSTLPSARYFSRSFTTLAPSDFADIFSLIVDPFNTTKPSEVTLPVATAFPLFMYKRTSSMAVESVESGWSSGYPKAFIIIFTLSMNSSIAAICDSFITVFL